MQVFVHMSVRCSKLPYNICGKKKEMEFHDFLRD